MAIPQFLYASYFIREEKRSLDFYLGLLGMTERMRIEVSPILTEILLGYDKDPLAPGLSLMLQADRSEPYEVGDGYSRIVLRVPDLSDVIERMSAARVAVVTPRTDVAHLGLSYFTVRDPDGYRVELMQIG